MLDSEELRAREYRRKMIARSENKLAREKALAPDPRHAVRVKQAWDPITNKNRTWDPPPTPDDEK
jgi:hypothetical protein